jgi:hypothetical protein
MSDYIENYLVVDGHKQPILNCVIPRSYGNLLFIDLLTPIYQNIDDWIKNKDIKTVYLLLCKNKYTVFGSKINSVNPIKYYMSNAIRLSLIYHSFVQGINSKLSK